MIYTYTQKKINEFTFEEIMDNQLNILKNPYPVYYVKKK